MKNKIQDEMEVVRRFQADLPVDVIGIIQTLGIAYVEEPMNSGNSGRIDFHDPFCTITVNADESPSRKRFTAAHELGHYLFHRDLLDEEGHLDRLYEPGGIGNPYMPLSPSHEVQANRFAADLLMPKRMIADRVEKFGYTASSLAEEFGVSASAMRVRLESLGFPPSRVQNAE